MIHRFRLESAAGLLFCLAPAAFAQWLNYTTAGIPRTPDGKPDLSAPAPRTADGRPDLSGIWEPDKYYLANANLGIAPGDVSLSLDGEQRRKQLTAPGRACLPGGIPQLSGLPGYPFKILPSSGMIAILYEAFEVFRQIFLDGRQPPKDPNPTWLGYSVGRWDGDTLVVDSDGFNDKGTIPGGGPHSEALHIIGRFHRKDFGHMEIQFTIDDPKTYRKPWSFKEDHHLLPDTELLEYICNENEKDLKHIVNK